MEERELLDIVVDYWVDVVQPETRLNACILAGRLLHEVLGYFNIEHELLPVNVAALNDDMYEFHMAGSVGEPKNTGWSVVVGMNNKGMVAPVVQLQDGKPPPKGWDGHLVAVTEHHYVDLTAQQFHRPLKHIIVNGPMVARAGECRLIDVPGLKMNHFDLVEGHYLWVPEDNHTYKGSVDWRLTYKRYAGDLIRMIKREQAKPTV